MLCFSGKECSEFPKKVLVLIGILTWNTYLPEIGSALWFLTALLISDLIYMIIDIYVKSPLAKNIIIMILFITGCNERYIFHRQLPLGIGASLVGCIYIHIAGKIKRILFFI